MTRGNARPFEIRPARQRDAAGIARLAGELGYPAAEAQTAERLEQMLPLGHHDVLVAEADGRLLGWAAAEVRILLVAGPKAELMGLVVAAEARRLGVGTALVRAIERRVAARGLEALTVRSNAARAESHPFYERLGYARTKSQHVYVKRIAPAA